MGVKWPVQSPICTACKRASVAVGGRRAGGGGGGLRAARGWHFVHKCVPGYTGTSTPTEFSTLGEWERQRHLSRCTFIRLGLGLSFVYVTV